MDDYTKLLPYLVRNLGDFEHFQKYLGDIDYSKSSFNLYNKGIKSWEEVGNVEHIGGDFDLYGTPVTDLGNLKSVGGFLNLFNTPITDLGHLESVGGALNLRGTPITSLGNLKSVGGPIYYDEGTPVEKILKERGLI